MTPRSESLNKQMRDEALSRITQAALRLFADFGYAATTMEQIMKATGLSKGLVYHYFPSKEKIFYHLIDSALEISKSAWEEALTPPGPAWEKIRRLSAKLVKVSFTEDSSLYSRIILQATMEARSHPGLAEYIFGRATHFQMLPPLIVEAQQAGDAVPGDPAVLATAYFALFQGFTLFLVQNESLKANLTPEIFTNLLRNPQRSE